MDPRTFNLGHLVWDIFLPVLKANLHKDSVALRIPPTACSIQEYRGTRGAPPHKDKPDKARATPPAPGPACPPLPPTLLLATRTFLIATHLPPCHPPDGISQ